MKWFLIAILNVSIYADINNKNINEWKLEEQYREGDDLEPDDLPEHERPKKPIDVNNLDLSNPLSVVAETKHGQTLMVFVDIRGQPTEDERDQITVIWEANLINAFNIEAQRFPIAPARVIFKLARAQQVLELADMLRLEERCYSFQVEQQLYLCPGHPQWDAKNPGISKQKMETDKTWKGDDWRPKGWVERLEYVLPTQAPPKPTKKSTYKFKKGFAKKKKTEL